MIDSRRNFYIAQGVIMNDEGKVEKGILCGLYQNRQNAYKSVNYIMDKLGVINYIPYVRIAAIVDIDSNNPEDWEIENPEKEFGEL